ncbi:putative leucine-rich repeat domain superfamily, F-box-like domain superfamily [Dioscorea sansibarensis]
MKEKSKRDFPHSPTIQRRERKEKKKRKMGHSKSDEAKSTTDQGDRLSALPSELLHQILAFLPDTKSRGRTCVLSRRWIRLWASHPSIDLPLVYHLDLTAAARSHAAAVDAALSAASPGTLRRVAVDLWLPSGPHLRPSNAATVDRWFRASARLAVSELDIQGKSFPEGGVSSLPSSIYSCSTLAFLRIKTGFIPGVPRNFDGFCALATLLLEHVSIHTATLAAILAACPLLQAFQMEGFVGVTRLDVSPEKLPKLASFALSEPYGAPVTANIAAPNITSILFVGDLNLLFWNGSPCLVDATLRNITKYKFKSESSWLGLVSAVSNAKFLTLNNLFYQFVIPRKFVNGIHDAMFKNLHNLTCEIDWVTGPLLSSFISNIKECPLLESLCIRFNRELRLKAKNKMKRSLGFYYYKSFLPAELVKAVEEKFERDYVDLSEHCGGPGNALNCLKILAIEHFMGTKNEVLLTKFLQKNAANLQKFTIDDFFMRSNEEIHELLYPILSNSDDEDDEEYDDDYEDSDDDDDDDGDDDDDDDNDGGDDDDGDDEMDWALYENLNQNFPIDALNDSV